MKTNHTAEIWRIEQSNKDYLDIEGPRGRICDIWTQGEKEQATDITEEEALRNAKLIAAAPELLEALRQSIQYLDELMNKDEQRPHFINHAKEIMKKATE